MMMVRVIVTAIVRSFFTTVVPELNGVVLPGIYVPEHQHV